MRLRSYGSGYVTVTKPQLVIGGGSGRLDPVLVPEQMPRNFSNAPSHKRSGLHSPTFDKFDDSIGDDPVGVIVCKPKSYASHFERDTQSPFGFGIDIEVV